MLSIENLTVSLNNKKILENFNLAINENETHILMGPNGCGKSTLSKTIAGHPFYKIENGKIFFKSKDLLNLSPDVRALHGIFLGFQNPIEIPGINNFEFLNFIYNQKNKFLNKNEVSPIEFFSILKPYLSELKIDKNFLERGVNEGFSGGEKKKNEILQLLLLSPDFCILDELDSGVDVDSLKTIFNTISKYRKKNSSFLFITHSSRILKFFENCYVHLMHNGQIIKTGNKELANYIDNFGYTNL
jgi:Fe-S cluster assembly ATP-binding protein